jgi:hypothetical protein
LLFPFVINKVPFVLLLPSHCSFSLLRLSSLCWKSQRDFGHLWELHRFLQLSSLFILLLLLLFTCLLCCDPDNDRFFFLTRQQQRNSHCWPEITPEHKNSCGGYVRYVQLSRISLLPLVTSLAPSRSCSF